jgi:hypothetical protein
MRQPDGICTRTTDGLGVLLLDDWHRAPIIPRLPRAVNYGVPDSM